MDNGSTTPPARMMWSPLNSSAWIGCSWMRRTFTKICFCTPKCGMWQGCPPPTRRSPPTCSKCRYLDEMTDRRGVIFATGTPVSNSMTEHYTMLRYLQYEILKSGPRHFDCWASTFGETVTAIELAPEGTGISGADAVCTVL